MAEVFVLPSTPRRAPGGGCGGARARRGRCGGPTRYSRGGSFARLVGETAPVACSTANLASDATIGLVKGVTAAVCGGCGPDERCTRSVVVRATNTATKIHPRSHAMTTTSLSDALFLDAATSV